MVKVTRLGLPKYMKKMFQIERKEHPTLPIKTVKQIVKDHYRLKK